MHAEFVHGFVARLCGTSHSVVLPLSERFAATTVLLTRRAGIEVEMPASEVGHACGGVRRNVEAPGNAWVSSAAVDDLDTRAREAERRMAR
ncbi:hypothetical protein G3I32_29455 [Streptomyces coelicoflavus]|uniref:Uncharacterized protein n=2 Tax=Streptomyces coelicoflavus TaxID=285562 RepID=A0A7K3PSV9_9ACTN|nr:hypothetical protein [Streptomyces coelicoflavus]